MKKNVMLCMGAVVLFIGCGNANQINTSKPKKFTKKEICKATIGTLFNQPLNIINVFDNSSNGKVLYLKYDRPSDGKLWRTACKILSNNEVTWASIRNDGSIGRWRTDETIKYSIQGNKITISDYYGSELAKRSTYTLDNY